ncbi:hypothetical protein RCL1_002256 [Eukaryota sp. TZLM3-RCL]
MEMRNMIYHTRLVKEFSASKMSDLRSVVHSSTLLTNRKHTYRELSQLHDRFPKSVVLPVTVKLPDDDSGVGLSIAISTIAGVKEDKFPLDFTIILREYPQERPFVFVLCSDNKNIKDGHSFVSLTGNCVRHPLLSNWNPRETSLHELISIITEDLSIEPPYVTTSSPKYSQNSPQCTNEYIEQVLKRVQEKVREEFEFVYSESLDELGLLLNEQSDLSETMSSIEHIEACMLNEEEKLTSNIKILKSHNEQIEEILQEFNPEPVTSNDVLPMDEESERLLEASSSVVAHEEMVLLLKERLLDGTIQYHDFKEQTSAMFRQQFQSVNQLKKMAINKESV